LTLLVVEPLVSTRRKNVAVRQHETLPTHLMLWLLFAWRRAHRLLPRRKRTRPRKPAISITRAQTARRKKIRDANGCCRGAGAQDDRVQPSAMFNLGHVRFDDVLIP